MLYTHLVYAYAWCVCVYTTINMCVFVYVRA